MTFTRLAAAARRRHAALRSGERPDDGFMLIYVLLVTSMITVLVSTTLVASAGSVVPAQKAAYNQAADAAAQGGLQAFLSYADTNCSGVNSAVSTCTLPSSDSGTTTIYSGGGYTSTFRWTAVKGTSYFRVTSTGTVSRGRITSTKTLVADIAGGTSGNTLDYGVVTQYETQPPDLALTQYPARTIALNSTAAANAGLPAGSSSVSWAGAKAGTTAGTVNVCNAYFSGATGRVNNPPPGAPHPYVDWAESGSIGSNTYTNYQPCQVSMGHSTTLLAPTNAADGAGGYVTKDALLLSNSWPGGTGPRFDQPVTTGYKYNPATDGNCATQGENYREFNLACAGYAVNVGGSPSSASAYKNPAYSANILTPPTGTPTIPADSCVYTGPTRILLNADGSATVTSPQTTTTWVSANASTRPAACYTGATVAYGMSLVSIPAFATVTNGVVQVKNNGSPPSPAAAARTSTGWNLTGQKATDSATTGNTVFNLTGAVPPTVADTGSSSADATCTSDYSAAIAAACAWTNLHSTTDGNGSGSKGWTSYSGSGSTGCSGLSQTNRQQFECDMGGGTVTAGHDNYAVYRSRIASDLAGNTCLSGTLADQTTCLGNILTSRAPYLLNTSNNTGYRYIVSASSAGASTTSTKTLSTNSAPAAGDAFFDSSAVPGSATVETKTTTPITFTVSRQVYACYGLLGLLSCLLGGSPGWGDGTYVNASTPQFTVTMTQSTWAITQAGSAGQSYFPSMQDVTQYGMGAGGTFGTTGPGNLFVEGTSGASLAMVADNDVVVTGNLAPGSSTDALEIVGRNNVRVYHPVKCVSTTGLAGTTAGFCPNDVTGLYGGVLTSGARPDQQYTNLRPDLAGLTINAAIFAQGNAASSVSCPKWNGAGTCGGTFTVDNFNRGDSVGTASLGNLTVTGSLAMVHHGPVGQEWEIPDATGQSSRPYSGYQFVSRYQNLKAALNAVTNIKNVLSTVSTTSSLWRVISVSTAANP